MAFTENLAQFFDTDDFAVAATFTPSSGGGGSTINGIFDADYIAADVGGQVAISGESPVFQCRSADCVNAVGGTLVVSGTTYSIVEARPDGTGTTILILQEAA